MRVLVQKYFYLPYVELIKINSYFRILYIVSIKIFAPEPNGENERLSEVAYALNFHDQSHFIRDIKHLKRIYSFST
jgi:AraC-like DNA-binding protein